MNVTRFIYILFLSAFGMIIIHILTIFFIPLTSNHKAFDRYNNAKFSYQFRIPENKDLAKKTKDPSFDIAVCFFDLNKGPIHISSKEKISFWSLSIYDQKGINNYSTNSHALMQDHLDLVISDAYQLVALNQRSQKSAILPNHFKKGFVVLRAFKEHNDSKQQSKIFLKKALCQSLFQ